MCHFHQKAMNTIEIGVKKSTFILKRVCINIAMGYVSFTNSLHHASCHVISSFYPPEKNLKLIDQSMATPETSNMPHTQSPCSRE